MHGSLSKSDECLIPLRQGGIPGRLGFTPRGERLISCRKSCFISCKRLVALGDSLTAFIVRPLSLGHGQIPFSNERPQRFPQSELESKAPPILYPGGKQRVRQCEFPFLAQLSAVMGV